uniref:RNA-directed DNA polymerase, eukaryota, reverse transcriptase zinc-binding domain protein n=1 Tax=Tanacetum cinerariifolium TaxID=118510 RepID=A0A6L2JR39_TANCI|nr:RNA-directed DNA polymerase, eukaryota, reverse transcriptase zinc-binding domain protein [Tanacetum cinerariifolium]
MATVIYATGFNDVETLKGVFESLKFGHYIADSPRVSLYRVARLLQDKLKAGELAKDKIQAEEGQMFGFCRFIKVSNSKTVIDSLSNVWIGKLRLHDNVARFDRKVAVKPSHAHVNVVSHAVNNNCNVSQATKANSYVNVAKASFNSGEKPSSKDQVDERLIWLEIEGVHIRAWNNEIFSHICSRWGDALFMNGSDRELSSWTPTYVGNDCESDDEGTMGNFDQHQDKASVENDDESVAVVDGRFQVLCKLDGLLFMLLNLNQSGLDMDGFQDLVIDTWKNDGIVESNILILLKKKLQNLKQVIRNWVATKKVESQKLQKDHQHRLSIIDAKVHKGDANKEDFINRKILANRLRTVIGSCISSVQSAFIQGRNILDGPLILNKFLSWYRDRKKELMVFKVDFEKAFDSLRWDFLDLFMEKLGFGLKWCSWINGCLRNARSSVLVNGSLTAEFELFKGLRQGDPLSPFLFILAMEGLHAFTCKAEMLGLFKGAYIGWDNMNISHLMYADAFCSWRTILSSISSLKQNGIDLISFSTRKIRNGESTRRRVPNIVEPEIRTIEEVVPMADRTMEELLQASTEGYGEAIVILEILAEIFEIKTNLLQLVQTNKFHGFERDNPHTHISNFKRMASTLKYRDVPNDAIKLMLFLYSLEGAARIWYDKEPPNSILTWDDLVKKFVNQFFPPSKTTHLKNEISRFTQRFEETFGEA